MPARMNPHPGQSVEYARLNANRPGREESQGPPGDTGTLAPTLRAPRQMRKRLRSVRLHFARIVTALPLLLLMAVILGVYVILVLPERGRPRTPTAPPDSDPRSLSPGRLAYEITLGVIGLVVSAALLLTCLSLLIAGVMGSSLIFYAPTLSGSWLPLLAIGPALLCGLLGIVIGRSARRRLLSL